MKKKLSCWIFKVLPHINIILSGMYLVFYMIDIQNSAMNFVDNDITKILLLFLSVGSIVSSGLLIFYQRSML